MMRIVSRVLFYNCNIIDKTLNPLSYQFFSTGEQPITMSKSEKNEKDELEDKILCLGNEGRDFEGTQCNISV
jgi:hypothetical protein